MKKAVVIRGVKELELEGDDMSIYKALGGRMYLVLMGTGENPSGVLHLKRNSST